jgi:hypothetical protein
MVLSEFTSNLIWTLTLRIRLVNSSNATNVVDITATLHETCQLVFYDLSVDKETRELRAEAVQKLGSVWMHTVELPDGASVEEKDTARMYEEASFTAMLESFVINQKVNITITYNRSAKAVAKVHYIFVGV